MGGGFWQKRISRRRLLTGAASAALIGGGAGLLLPRRLSSAGRSGSPAAVPVTAEDIWHTPARLAEGQFQALKWDSLDGQPVLRAASDWEGVYSSPVVKTRAPFTHVGLHWRADGPQAAGIQFELRTSADGRQWSPWQSTWIEGDSSDNRRGETFASLVWAQDARFVQYRAHFQGEAQDSPLLRYVVVTALNAAPPSAEMEAARRTPTRTPRPTGTPTPVSNAADLPPPFDSDYLLTREEWGAPESYRVDQWGREFWPRMYVPTKKIVVHHTATLTNTNPQDPTYPYPNYTYDQAVQDVRAIYYYHAITRGWGDIGYNALIDRFGRVFEGRRGRDTGPQGGREIISPDVVAGHALNCNEGAAGVSLLGNFDVNPLGSTEESNMVKALLDFLTWSCRRHYISPSGVSDFLMVNLATVLNLPSIAGHCDVNATSCPGRYVYYRLPEWRQTVAKQISQAAAIEPSAEFVGLPGQADIAAGKVSFNWKSDSASALFAYYLEGWIGNLDTDEVYYITGFTGDKRPAWSNFSSDTSASLTLPQAGRYTFHVRAKDAKTDNEGAYENNHTFIYGSQRVNHTIGVPGVTKN